jgi:DNA (cytosine-5)-methyltransferase 1
LTASAQQSLDAETETLVAVAHTLRGEGHDASEDGTCRGVPLIPVGVTIHGTDKTASVASYTDIAGALRARTPGSQENSSTTVVQSPFAFAQNTRDEVRLFGGDGASVGALAAEPGMKQQAYVAQPFTIMERGRDGGQSLESRQDGTSNAILTPNGGRGGMGVGAIATAWTVRRLTPVECERLQAFPDQFTRIPYRGKPAEQCPDGPRYKALGNSMAVNVMQLIGERIAIVENYQ